MDPLFRQLNVNESSEKSNPEIQKCPFLRNINEPTNFSFASSSAVPTPACSRGGARGPIFEDEPNFDTAFSIFHGRDGVVPLSGRSSDRVKPQSAQPHSNPLAAKAASISLSSFSEPFSFNSFSDQWKKQDTECKPFNKKGNSKHKAMSSEWLASGSCPIAKSYRAVNNVIPLVAKALHPPPGMKLQCPPATTFAENLWPQPLSSKVLVIGLMGMAANVSLGIWREHATKFSPSWFGAVHAAVPFIAILRNSVLMPKSAMALTIAASILGQAIGSRAEQYRLDGVAAKNPSSPTTLFDELCRIKDTGASNGHCSELESCFFAKGRA